MRTVTKQDHADFIADYPRQLIVDVSHIYTPPVKIWNDFTLGDWPDSVVASCCLWFDPETGKDEPEKYIYQIAEGV